MLDAYDRRARLRPGLLVAAPLALSLVPLLRELPTLWEAAAPTLVGVGGTYVIASLARWAGKRAEPALFAAWGGAPTTQLLRHRGPSGPVAVAHRHKQLARLFPDIRMPAVEEEAADPEGADHVYETAVRALRDATRDREVFPLVFSENCYYGFCRNSFGLRRWGGGAALAALGAAGGALIGEHQLGVAYSTTLVCAFALDAAACVFWLFLVKPPWVRIPADAYAERLLGAADQLP